MKERLRIRAVVHGLSMESEIRAVLEDAVSGTGESDGLFATLLGCFASIGGAELELPERSTSARAAELAP